MNDSKVRIDAAAQHEKSARDERQAEYLTVAQAARRHGVSYKTVWRRIKDNLLSAYQVGGLDPYRLRVEDVDALMTRK